MAPGVLARCDRQQVEDGPPSAVSGAWERRRVTSGSACSRTGGGWRSDKVRSGPPSLRVALSGAAGSMGNIRKNGVVTTRRRNVTWRSRQSASW